MAQNNKPLGVIFMGSKADEEHCQNIAKELAAYGVESELRICSAHKAPKRLMQIMERYETCGRPIVYLTVAGRSNALSGMAASNVKFPVIACPPAPSSFGGADIFSSISMPGGVCPMLVLDAKNAAMATCKIFGLIDENIVNKVMDKQKNNSTTLHVDDCELKSKLYVKTIEKAVANKAVFTSTDLKLKPQNGATEVDKYVGKVRDRYNDGKYCYLITTDRLTGFDRPLANIPFKGQVLNLVSKWWFEQTQHIIKNHVLDLNSAITHPNLTVGRACKPFPIEFVVRGYLTGSSATSVWTHYQKGVRSYCGVELPDGMVANQKLAKNVVTPTTKSDVHDELITPEEIVKGGYMTQEEWDYCSKKALELFEFGQKVAYDRGLILVDTKYEMGRDVETGEILLIDEIHTPDSSRYWIAATYEDNMKKGKSPQNIDKEFIRLWFKDNCDPYKDEKLPEAPADLITELSRRYVMLYELITGEDFGFPDSSLPINEAVQAIIDLKNA